MDVRELMAAAGVHIDDSAKLHFPIPDGGLQLRSEFLDGAVHPRSSGIVTGYARSAGAQP
jgi:hypothetical protein